ncbi:hypothetical protein DL546_000062 [Coniochaeta pulveracea]|uniref:FHA domain-containing protein n=1 Tax=Coniochaeta pulveracea TaxID=177199 RepID=A0A420XW83_9PEZI|nr:hypothetical protein DL546_000062 [Coniochaeta pulveracea]
MTHIPGYVEKVGRGYDKETSPTDTMVENVRTSEKAQVDSRKMKLGCRELVGSNASLPRVTPSILLHITGCTCAAESKEDSQQQRRHDEALARQIQAASAICRAKRKSGSPTGSPRNVSIAAFQSVSRWFSSAATDNTTTEDLCSACDTLDITAATRLLFDDIVSINARNTAGVPPLIAAARSPFRTTRPRSHLAMLSFLLDAGADPNIATTASPICGAMSALAVASTLGLDDAVRLLLGRGAAVSAEVTSIPMFRFTGHGMTALHAAVFAEQSTTAEILLRHGKAEVGATCDGQRASRSTHGYGPKQQNRRTWTTGITPLHLADDSPRCTGLVLRYGADPAARDGSGRTPLHWAMAAGNPEVVDSLLKSGTPVDALDDDGATPLALLVARVESGGTRQGHPAVVRMLLTAGANPDLRYPRDLSVKARLLNVDKWRSVYEPSFEMYQMRSPSLS